MLRRQTYVENRRVLADSGVITTPLNVRDPITSLFIEIRATNGGSWNVANTMMQCVQSIELLDGSNVIFSLTGPQAFAYACYRKGWMPFMEVSEFPGADNTLAFEYLFGRWPGDTIYAFDPTKFANPMLRLTWNLATVRAVGALGFLTGTGLYTVIANVMEGAPAPQAMLSTRQHYQFVTAVGATTFIDLPTDRRIKMILLRSSGANWGGIPGVSRAKLTCDQDKFIPFDLRQQDVINLLSNKNPPYHYKHSFDFKNGDTIFPLMKWDEDVQLQGYQGDDVYMYTNNGQGNGVVNVLLAGVADANMRSYSGHVTGWFPMHTAGIDLGEWDDPATWLDPSSFHSIQLQLTQDVAAMAASVALETELVY